MNYNNRNCVHSCPVCGAEFRDSGIEICPGCGAYIDPPDNKNGIPANQNTVPFGVSPQFTPQGITPPNAELKVKIWKTVMTVYFITYPFIAAFALWGWVHRDLNTYLAAKALRFYACFFMPEAWLAPLLLPLFRPDKCFPWDKRLMKKLLLWLLLLTFEIIVFALTFSFVVVTGYHNGTYTPGVS